jgi:asparagine synthase (glutamine-hydrolysing)
MSFLGAVSADLQPVVDRPFASTSANILPFLASHDLKGQRLALWGRAPFAFSDGQGILLDGRIFNVVELAGRLGVDPLNQPMLLLHAYRRWGADFPRHLEGEFALALWDSSVRRLLLARDPTGYRPLVYSQQGEDLRFASEARTLLAWPDTQMRPDEDHIAHWLALISTGTDSTFFKNIFTLPPGHNLLFENGRVVVNDLWQPEKIPMLRLKDSREYADGLREVLRTAVSDRLEPGSVCASQLSGGLDSSSVTALAAGLLQPQGRRIFAFTAVPEHAVIIPRRFSDEGPRAASVAAMYPNVDHLLVRHGSHATFSMIDRFNSAQQEPVFNPANYEWLYEICLQARHRGVDSLLTGAAGNLTASYDGAAALPALARQGRVLEAARIARGLHREGAYRWVGIAQLLLRPWLPVWARQAADRLRGNYYATGEYSMIRREFALSHGLDSMIKDRRMHNLDDRSVRLVALRRIDPGAAMEAFRQLSGVSMTDPTADPRVVAYCLSVPLEHFCEDGVPRSLIRNAMAGVLPEPVRTERLRGVQAADFDRHFRAERQEALDELVRIRKAGLAARALNLPAIESMMHWSEAQIEAYGRKIYWGKLMRAFSLGRFLRRLEDGTLFAQPESP